MGVSFWTGSETAEAAGETVSCVSAGIAAEDFTASGCDGVAEVVSTGSAAEETDSASGSVDSGTSGSLSSSETDFSFSRSFCAS